MYLHPHSYLHELPHLLRLCSYAGFPPFCILYPSTHLTTFALLLLSPERDKTILALPLALATPFITLVNLSREGVFSHC